MGFQGRAVTALMGRYGPRFPGGRGRPAIDKSKSMCNACQKYGHWAGDAACLLSGGIYPELQPPGEEK